MVHEADPSLEDPHSMPSSFFRASDGGAAAAALAPVNTRFGENESDLHVDAPPKGRRVAFDFSAFQKQHEAGPSQPSPLLAALVLLLMLLHRKLLLAATIGAWDGMRWR